jgi:WhiB family transcriptional regulator, redox-sensing transcriptional regulator
MGPKTWRQLAACRGIDPLVFYPTAEDDVVTDRAKSICHSCPVREPCLDHALMYREREGVWGGATERERRRMIRQRRKSA